MSSLVFRITGDPGSFKAAMGEVSNSLDAAGRKAQSVSHQMSSLGSSLTIGLTLPVVAAGTAFVKAAADMEKLNKGLASVMGSVTAGTAEMKKLQDAAKLPGLGLEGAVQGSIRLQVLGKTADQSRKIMAELGNAIALVGGGKDDFAEVTRQLGQMLSVGKVTKENLDTITERIPQISKIMIDTWGPQSVGDPAKFFEKAGISSREFVDIIVSKLGEGARAGDTFANKLGNLEEAIKLASARIGDKMLPALEKLLPKLEGLAIGAADAVESFLAMPEPIKNAAIALGLLTVAAGPVIGVIGKIVGAIGAIKAVAGAAGVALGALFGSTVIAMIVQTMTAIDQLNQRYADLKKARDLVASGKADTVSGLTQSGDDLGKFKIDLKAVATELNLFGETVKSTTPPVTHLTGALDKKSAAAKKAAAEIEGLRKVTFDSQVEHKALGLLLADYNRNVDRAAELTHKYGTTNIDTAIALAKTADAQFRLNRVLEDAPMITNGGIQFKDIPKFEAPELPVSLKPDGSDNNIGPVGMQTKEQYDRMVQAAKDAAREQSTALKAVSLAVNDLSAGIAKSIMQWKGFAAAGKSALDSVGEFLIRSALEKQLKRIGDQILKMTVDTGALGKVLGAVFGGGAAAVSPVIKNATDVAGGAAGAVGSGTGGAGGAVAGASSGLMGAVTAIASVGSLISGIVGNFQNMAMNKSLDLIEHETRYSQIHLLHTLNRANEFWPYMKLSWESLLRMEGKGSGASGTVINNNINGGFFVGNNAIDELLDMLTRRLKQQGA